MRKIGLVVVAVASLLAGCTAARDGSRDSNAFPSGPLPVPDVQPNTPGGEEGTVVVLPEGEHETLSLAMTAGYHSADVVFLMDSTGSMGDQIAVLSSAFGAIVDSVAAVVPDAAFGVCEYKDYAIPPNGADPDVPFRLDRALTTDVHAVHDALSHLSPFGGGNPPESQYEALYQVATGDGFDLHGDGVLDSVDVAPFIARATDAFGGSVSGTYAATSGTGGGVGFRAGALHLVVHASDTNSHDPDAGWTLGNAGTAPHGKHDAITALKEAGIHVIGIASGSPAVDPMNEVAVETAALADRDGDGVDDVLVYSLGADAEALPASVADAVERMATAHETTPELHVEGDEWGFVTSAEGPDATIHPGDSVSLNVNLVGSVPQTAEDQQFTFILQLTDSDGAILGSQPVTVRVPGYSASTASTRSPGNLRTRPAAGQL